MIDTHVFVWWDGAIPRLGRRAREMIAATDNRVFVSAASVWEIAIKRRIGRIGFEGGIAAAVHANSFNALSCDLDDCELAGSLEWDHSDPFDRMIVAQAQRRELTLVTADSVVMAWPGVAMIRAQT